jgi:hypothetical protein
MYQLSPEGDRTEGLDYNQPSKRLITKPLPTDYSILMTLDSDFKIYGKNGRQVIPTIMPANMAQVRDIKTT